MDVHPAPRTDRRDLLLAGLVALFAVAAGLFASRPGIHPAIADEFVYLFQAKTFASGHVSYPSPPHPEFFDATHLLVVPRFAAKYFPGHALWLTPFMLLGATWVGPLVSLGLAAAMLFLALRKSGASLVAAFAAPALFLASADLLQIWTGLLSHSTAALWVCGGALAAARFARSHSTRSLVALTACAAMAGLTRPYAGLAASLAAAFALLPVEKDRPTLRQCVVGALPLALGALAAVVFAIAVTGRLASPWGLYAKQYTPFDGPGFAHSYSTAAPERGLPPHLQGMFDAFLRGRQEHTLSRLPAEAYRRLARLFDFGALGAGLMALLAALALRRVSALLRYAAGFVIALWGLNLSLSAGGHYYLTEAWPLLCVVAALGLDSALDVLGRIPRPKLRLATTAALLGGGALYLGLYAVNELPYVAQLGSTEADYYARVRRALAPAGQAHGLVFLHYPKSQPWTRDLTWNEPDLARAKLIVAIDRGEEDALLAADFPGRPTFLFDVATLTLSPLRFPAAAAARDTP